MDHLRHAGLPEARQRAALIEMIGGNALVMDALRRARALALPDWYVASGAIYNSVWNTLTGRPPLTGIKDVDLLYFDAADLSWAAEDAVIRKGETAFAGFPLPVEIRNQARVHLWYPERFGAPYPPLACASDALLRYASTTHAVAMRLEPDDTFTIVAPFGLDPIFSFRVVPNRGTNNARTHTEKAARAKSVWPELQIEPW